MALNDRTIIKIGKVTTESGVVCKNPTVKLIGFPNVYVNCVDNIKGIYEVQLPENGNLSSLQFSVSCNNDECENCNTQIKEFYFCNNSADCPDCHDCGSDGFCKPRCETEFCLDGNCVDCTKDSHCPCNQKCDDNGNCGCPPGFYVNSKGCCIECESNSDCSLCEICTESGTCIPKDCVDGHCDPQTGVCDECVTNDHCGENQICVDGECECISGYVYDNCEGECIIAPENKCKTDDDCSTCFNCIGINPCTGYGSCTPKECPDGKICYNDDCVDECECGSGNCASDTDHCFEIRNNECGCVDCQGDCENGCGDGCFCNEATNQCEGNPCANTPCVDGTDCGNGCGCDPVTSRCIPCNSLDCFGTSCDQVLGCNCKGAKCDDADKNDSCNNSPCSVDSDCGDGCTCYEGTCVSCSNFSCLTGSCAERSGCTCSGNVCVGAESDCLDTITMTKDDLNCELTGVLTKDECCSCSKLTFDTKIKRLNETENTQSLSFKLELRKGDYTVLNSINSLSLLGNTNDSNIAENEKPTSGLVTLIYNTFYDVYNLNEEGNGIGETRLSSGSLSGSIFSTINNSGKNYSFADKDTITIENIALDKIGKGKIVGDEYWLVKSTEIKVHFTSKLEFPNDCEYNSSEVIKYKVNSSSPYSRFNDIAYGSTKALVLSSDDCRKPFAKWYKSTDNSYIESEIIRKLYIDPTGLNVWEDTIGGDEGVRSCRYFNLEIDCNCDEPFDSFVAFCNPSDIEFTLSNCNTAFRLDDPFTPCVSNQTDVVYFIDLVTTKSGTTRKTFTYATRSTVLGKIIETTSQISSIRYGILCNNQEFSECTKVYNVDSSPINFDDGYIVECTSNGLNLSFNSTATVGVNTFNVDRIAIQSQSGTIGTTLSDTLSTNGLPAGTYNVTVYWVENCDPTTLTIQEDCCVYEDIQLTRNCKGVWSGNINLGYSYQIEGKAGIIKVTTSQQFIDYLNTNYKSDPLTLLVSNGNCPVNRIVFPSTKDECCSDFGVSYRQLSNTSAVVMLSGSQGLVQITEVKAYKHSAVSYNLLTVNQNNDYSYTITGYDENDTVIIQAENIFCGIKEVSFTASTCNLNLELEQYQSEVNEDECKFDVVLDNVNCGCPTLNLITDIKNVNFGANSLSFVYETIPIGFDQEDTTAYTLKIGKRGSTQKLIGIRDAGTIDLPYTTTTIGSDCYFSSKLEFQLVDSVVNGRQPILITSITKNGLPLLSDPNLRTLSVTVSNGTETEVAAYSNAEGTFSTSHLFKQGNNITITVNVGHINGDTYLGQVSLTNIQTATSYPYTISICKEELVPFDKVNVDFTLEGLKTVDGCTYADKRIISYSFSGKSQTVSPSPAQLNTSIEASVPKNSQRPTMYILRDGVRVVDDYLFSDSDLTSNGLEYRYTLPSSLNQRNSTYEVYVSCASCATSGSVFLTCLPTITTTLNNDGTAFTVKLCTTDPDLTGGYNIKYGPTIYSTTIPSTANGTNQCLYTNSVQIIGPLTYETVTVGSVDTGFEVEVTIDGIGALIPTYVPDAYNPSYTTPSYVPTYGTPSYATPSYTPIYTPALYAPTYTTPTYTPNYLTPSYLTPTYVTPTYTVFNYVPTYVTPTYTPVYTPSYITPSYVPVYLSPSYNTPTYLTPTYVSPTYLTPTYITPTYLTPAPLDATPATSPGVSLPPSYTPTYLSPTYVTPSYTPLYIGSELQCDGCEYLGVCCNEITNSTECENAVSPLTLEELAFLLEVDIHTLADDPQLSPNPCTWSYGIGVCQCTIQS